MAEEERGAEAERNVEDETNNVEAPPRRVGVTLQPNDVLIGRGTAYNDWVGNHRFRVLVEERKDPYNAAKKNKTKSKLAKEFFDYLKETVGARFLLLEDTDENIKDVISQGVWYEVDESVALEKIKQAFRQRSDKKKGTRAKPCAKQPTVARLKNDESRSSSSPSSTDQDKKPQERTREVNVNGGKNKSESKDSLRRKRDAAANGESAPEPPSNMDFRPGPATGYMSLSEATRPSSYAPPIRDGVVSSASGTASLNMANPIGTPSTTFPSGAAAGRPALYASPIPPPTLMGSSAVDPRPLLFQRDVLGLFQPQRRQHQAAGTNVYAQRTISAERMAKIIQRDVMEVGIRTMMREQNLGGANEHTDIAALRHIENRLNDDKFEATVKTVEASFQFDADIEDGLREVLSTASAGSTAPTSGPSSVAVDQDAEEAANTLSAMSLVADLPVISEQEEVEEKANMTGEERSAALSDLFGRFCRVSSHEKKRARRDFDQPSVDSLIRQMRIELEMIPRQSKKALSEAQRRCRYQEEEFGDARLLKFLESQGMNAKLAAKRFNNYWEARLALLGPEKYLLRMTLSEAFCDDVEALLHGFLLLPFPDESGRPLIYMEPIRNTRHGYTTESLVRSGWYVMEIMAREHDDFVFLLWEKNASLWNYDRSIVSQVPYYYNHCWPIKPMPTHSCYPNAFVRRVIKPVLVATLSKDGRARTLIHDVPENEILDLLTNYGIRREMLPTSMGGTVDLDKWLLSWIAYRRAIEMEEI